MLKTVTRAFLLIALMAVPTLLLAQPAQPAQPTQPTQSGYAQVNGTEIHYDVRGDRPPLVMLHGGVSPAEMFGAPLAELAKNFKVIVISARGRGLSKDTDAPWSVEQDADDVAAVPTGRG